MDEQEEQKEAMQDMVQLLWLHPSHAHHMLSHLKRRISEEEVEQLEQAGHTQLIDATNFGSIARDENKVFVFGMLGIIICLNDCGHHSSIAI